MVCTLYCQTVKCWGCVGLGFCLEKLKSEYIILVGDSPEKQPYSGYNNWKDKLWQRLAVENGGGWH
jgi:hypothetical protein